MSHHISRICVCACLAVLGGILLWVQGSAAPVVYRTTRMPAIAPGLTACFLLWMLVYALSGVLLGVSLTPPVYRVPGTWRCCVEQVAVYTLLLAWYPLFFSVLHSFLACLVLSVCLFFQIRMFCRLYHKILLLIPVFLFQCALELYFLLYTILFFALNR